MTPGEIARYGRHLVLTEIGVEGQQRLKDSSVLIIGLGGLGVPAAVQLVSAGVGRVGIVDPDTIEVSNLQRQFIFSSVDLGRKKVDAAKEKLTLVNPDVKIDVHPVCLDSSNAIGLISNYDLVLDATDNTPSRYLINDACVLQRKPDIYGSALGFDGQTSVFKATEGPCYRCLFPEPPRPDSVKSCEQAGVLSVIPSVIGSIQANQAIAILIGKGKPLVGRLLVFDGLDNSFSEIKFDKDRSCAVCGSNPTITNLTDYEEFCRTEPRESVVGSDITPAQLKAEIDSGKRPMLLDVREPFEYSICHLEYSTLIPIEELPGRLEELNRNREIVVYCHVGIRSAGAVSLLRRSGFSRVRNLLGGIDEWARRVDTSVPRY